MILRSHTSRRWNSSCLTRTALLALRTRRVPPAAGAADCSADHAGGPGSLPPGVGVRGAGPPLRTTRTPAAGAERGSRRVKCLWRCRESNPGPSATNQGFYGRILSALFSAPEIPETSLRRAQPREFPSLARGRLARLSPLAMPDSRSGAILDRQIPTPGPGYRSKIRQRGRRCYGNAQH